MALKLGFDAIKYVLTKVLTKKGSKGIARIPGKAYDMRMKQLVDEMATKMRNLGYDINKVTEKNVQGLLDSAEALAKQKVKKASDDLIKRFDDIGSPPKKESTTESPLKGEEYVDESGRTWTFAPGTKKDDLPSWTKGWNPKIVPKETEAQIKARMIKQNRSNVQKSYLRQLDEKIMDEMEITVKEMDSMSSTALDDLRRNADPQGMQKHFDDITEGRGVGDFPDDPFKEPDYASGGIARVGMLMGGFTKAQVLIQMIKNTLKGSKDPYVKKTFPNFIKELTKNPELANDPNVWKQFTTGLPKNQRLIVHSDDSVDFFTQTEFGPHNIQRTLDFQKKHNLSRDQANTILRMEPEDRVLEMKRLETIADRKKGDVSDQTIKEIKDEFKDVSEKMILEDFTPTDKGHASGAVYH